MRLSLSHNRAETVNMIKSGDVTELSSNHPSITCQEFIATALGASIHTFVHLDQSRGAALLVTRQPSEERLEAGRRKKNKHNKRSPEQGRVWTSKGRVVATQTGRGKCFDACTSRQTPMNAMTRAICSTLTRAKASAVQVKSRCTDLVSIIP